MNCQLAAFAVIVSCRSPADMDSNSRVVLLSPGHGCDYISPVDQISSPRVMLILLVRSQLLCGANLQLKSDADSTGAVAAPLWIRFPNVLLWSRYCIHCTRQAAASTVILQSRERIFYASCFGISCSLFTGKKSRTFALNVQLSSDLFSDRSVRRPGPSFLSFWTRGRCVYSSGPSVPGYTRPVFPLLYRGARRSRFW